MTTADTARRVWSTANADWMDPLEVLTSALEAARAEGRAEGRQEVLDVRLTLQQEDACTCSDCIRDELADKDAGRDRNRAL